MQTEYIKKNRKQGRKESRQLKKAKKDSYYKSASKKTKCETAKVAKSEAIIKTSNDNIENVKHAKKIKKVNENNGCGGLQFFGLSDRMAQLQEFVNKETNKIQQNDVSKKKKKKDDLNLEIKGEKLLKRQEQLQLDKKQEQLQLDQKQEIINIKKIERKLHLLSYNKKANSCSAEFRDDFGSILKAIETGNMDSFNLCESDNDIDNDLYSVVDKPSNGNSIKQMNPSINEGNSTVNSDHTDDCDSFIVADDVIEYEGRPVNHKRRISDTESEATPKKNRKNSENYSEESEHEIDEYFDNEAEEDNEIETEEEYDEDNLRFEGGSMQKGNNIKKVMNAEKTVFDLYTITDEDDYDSDSEMDDFIVPDSDEELYKGKSVIGKCLKIANSNKQKRKRIKSMEDSDSDSYKEDIVSLEKGCSELSNGKKSKRQSVVDTNVLVKSNVKKRKKSVEDFNDNIDKSSQQKKRKKLESVETSNNEIVKPNKLIESVNYSSDEGNITVKTTKQKDNSKKVKNDKGNIKKSKDIIETQNLSSSKENDTPEEYHEDIYGRVRDKKGNIIHNGRNMTEQIYKTPAQRKLAELNKNIVNNECYLMLRKQLKGIMNRLTDCTMQRVANQVEAMYKKNSRNNMNEAMTKLLLDILAKFDQVPNRLIQEHALLISILSSNVGCEVGAHILTEFVIRWKDGFDNCQSLGEDQDVCSNEWENLLAFISYLFMFRVVDSCLIFDILTYLSQTLHMLQVKLILNVLRNVGFSLRKSDPLYLKKFISEVQAKTADCSEKNFTRMQFLLEIFMALKNNNMSKIPDYDPRHGEHLKSVMKACIRKGCNPNDLKVTLNDLIKSKVVGRWWIVGSAWSGGLKEEVLPQNESILTKVKIPSGISVYSEKFMKKAKKLYCAQPPRINILYALTEGSEDCMECVQNILQLKIADSQIKEIFNVLILCCQKGKQYNTFYAVTADNLCSYDRKYKGSLKLTLWDKFNELGTMKTRHISNLSKLTGELICKDSLNIAVFKNLPMFDPEPILISFVRQSLIVILMNTSGIYIVERVFQFLCSSPKLIDVKIGIKSFISKFISVTHTDEPDKQLLATRTKLALHILDSDEIVM